MTPILNRRLVLEQALRQADGAGGAWLNWVSRGTHWAQIIPGTGRETAGEAVTLSSVTYRIIVRASAVGAPSRPKPEQRFRDGTRIYKIAAVTEADPRGHYLLCVATEETVA